MASSARTPEHGFETIHVSVRARGKRFRCAGCGCSWTAVYEAREYLGPGGERWVVDCRDGQPVRGPQFGDRCPDCGDVSTTMINQAEPS